MLSHFLDHLLRSNKVASAAPHAHERVEGHGIWRDALVLHGRQQLVHCIRVAPLRERVEEGVERARVRWGA